MYSSHKSAFSQLEGFWEVLGLNFSPLISKQHYSYTINWKTYPLGDKGCFSEVNDYFAQMQGNTEVSYQIKNQNKQQQQTGIASNLTSPLITSAFQERCLDFLKPPSFRWLNLLLPNHQASSHLNTFHLLSLARRQHPGRISGTARWACRSTPLSSRPFNQYRCW